MFGATFRSLLAHRVRLALTALAIALGTGFMAGSFVFTATLTHSLDSLFAESATGTDVRPTRCPDRVRRGRRERPDQAAAGGHRSGDSRPARRRRGRRRDLRPRRAARQERHAAAVPVLGRAELAARPPVRGHLHPPGRESSGRAGRGHDRPRLGPAGALRGRRPDRGRDRGAGQAIHGRRDRRLRLRGLDRRRLDGGLRPADGAAAVRPGRPLQPDRGQGRRRRVRPATPRPGGPGPAPRRRGSHRRQRRGQPGPADQQPARRAHLLLRRLRGRVAVRRSVRDLEHLLDHGRPARP